MTSRSTPDDFPLQRGFPEDSQTLATPEGDNDDLPSQPLSPVDPTPIRPPGDQPHSIEPLRKALD